jgi:hypothetical protein
VFITLHVSTGKDPHWPFEPGTSTCTGNQQGSQLIILRTTFLPGQPPEGTCQVRTLLPQHHHFISWRRAPALVLLALLLARIPRFRHKEPTRA